MEASPHLDPATGSALSTKLVWVNFREDPQDALWIESQGFRAASFSSALSTESMSPTYGWDAAPSAAEQDASVTGWSAPVAKREAKSGAKIKADPTKVRFPRRRSRADGDSSRVSSSRRRRSASSTTCRRRAATAGGTASGRTATIFPTRKFRAFDATSPRRRARTRGRTGTADGRKRTGPPACTTTPSPIGLSLDCSQLHFISHAPDRFDCSV